MSARSEFLKSVSPEHRALVRDLDALIRESAPDLVPSLKWGHLTYHARRNACSIVTHGQHVNLQVWGGAGLRDPRRLLQGTGQDMRHIRFVVGARFNCSAVVAIVKQAAAVARV